jgi:UDP-glucose 4-epimerase
VIGNQNTDAATAQIKDDILNVVYGFRIDTSKWFIEQMLADFRSAYDLRSVSLRYFNAAGASPSD